MRKIFLLAFVVVQEFVVWSSPVNSMLGADGIEMNGESINIIPIEYLESTGTQWIDTEVPVVNGLECELVTEIEQRVGQVNIAGISVGGQKEERYFLRGSPDTGRVGTVDISLGYWWSNLNTSSVLGKHTLFIKNTFYGGNAIYGVDNDAFISTHKTSNIYSGRYSFCIMKVASTIDSGFRIYSIVLMLNNEIIYDAIPVRIGRIGYMYDRVSGELFGNMGTGEFILGPDVE